MSILKIARMGHPALRTKARALSRSEVKSAGVQKLIDDMIDTMFEYRGVGLAAPQVHEGVRLFVASLSDADSDEEPSRAEPLVLLNPEMVTAGAETVEDWEGCLSIPDIKGRVARARGIKIRALNRNGERVELDAEGFSARVIQHEYDHLDGILFLDRMRSLESLTFLYEYSRYWAKG